MTGKNKHPDAGGPVAAALRQQAEAALREIADRSPEDLAALAPEDTRMILHELRVHQIELEMQNEELRGTQAELVAARARYFDLYDLAPVGYCTLSEPGLILQANLTTTTQLGVTRGALVKQPISRFIHREDADQFHLLRQRLIATGEPQSCELRMVKKDGTQFWAHLAATVAPDADGGPVIRLVLSDVTALKRLQIQHQQGEADLRALNEQLEQRVAARTQELREKNTLMEEDLSMARELQLALLPHHFPTLPRGAPPAASAVTFCSLYRPTSSVSGDFFNVAPVSDTAVGVFICDVMGHGVRAALVTAMMRALEEQFHAMAGDPGALLTEINRALRGILRHSPTTLFTTACYLIVDIATSRIAFASAGHPSPLLVRGTTRGVGPIVDPDSTGPALGLFEDAHYPTQELPVAAGDLILFFTDGLFEVENTNDEAFGENRLRESVRQRAGLPPGQLMHDVFAEIEQFAKGRDFSDDVCLVALEIAHLDGSAG